VDVESARHAYRRSAAARSLVEINISVVSLLGGTHFVGVRQSGCLIRSTPVIRVSVIAPREDQDHIESPFSSTPSHCLTPSTTA
jgi:hypothetical protein